jgi:Cu/Zn superoxide dismutase
MTLETCLDVYPNYDGDINVAGKVKVTFDGTDKKFKFNMKNGDVDCLPAGTCGIHIHTGTTCEEAEGHYWDDTDGALDPWTPVGGAVYESNSKGKSEGKFFINSGFDYSENVGHAVVVHEAW